MEVDQSSSLQVETLGANLATGGLQEQIESGDTQQVNSSVEDEDGEEDDDKSSFTIEVGDSPKVLRTQ